MVGIPVYCLHCGALFASRAFDIKQVRQLNLRGNRETCPICGDMANMVDGTFDATGDVLTLLSGPQFTRDILRQFSMLVERAANREITDNQLRAEAEKIDPGLGEVVAQVQKRAGWAATAALLLAVIALRSCNFNVNVEVDLNEIWDQWTRQSTQQEVVVSPPSKRKTDDAE